MQIHHLDYIALLLPWIKASQQELYSCPDRPELLCYGTGYNTWGVQTNQKALSAFAVAAMDPDADFKSAGLERDSVLAQALGMLRFSLQSHIEGDYFCTDGQKWGHTWISVLGVERMMHAVEALEPVLTDEDKILLRKVLISEADWLLYEYPVVADLLNQSGKNKPESNIWNGAFLSRVALLYPDSPHTQEYRDKADLFFVNGISIESDRNSDVTYDGKKVRDLHVGANFYDSYALDHHGYLNVGYMVICLSNVAMIHFAYRKQKKEAPPALYHHVKELWKLIRSLMFDDGRLNRIGGDTRARYCYCQDYALPMELLMADYDDVDCIEEEVRWLQTIQKETAYNGDGSFLSVRCGYMKTLSPLYYTRLESDRANRLVR